MLLAMSQERPLNKEEISQQLLAIFRHYDSYRKQWEIEAEECYKVYIGYVDPLEKEQGHRSNLHIPRTYEDIDTVRSRIVQAFFKAHPYVEFVPMPKTGPPELLFVNERKAEIASALVDDQLIKNNIVNKFYEFVTSFLIFPAAIMAIGWRYERMPVVREIPVPNIVPTPQGPQFQGWRKDRIEGVETAWDDNEIQYVDFFDFWPDPRGTDLDTCRGVFQREWITEEDLLHKMEFLHQLGQGTVYPIDVEEVRKSGVDLKEGRWRRMTSVGISVESRDIYKDYSDPESKKKTLYELLHYWEDNRHAIIANRSQVIYDGPSPYWRHKKKPFVVASYEPMPGEFYGLSAVKIIKFLQHELNTTRNQRIDNVSFILNRMWKIKRGADINETELISRPAGAVYCDHPDDITEVAMQEIPTSAYTEEQITSRDMENALSVPPVIRGADSAGRRETATEVATKSSNASIRFDVKIALFENLGLKRMVKIMDMNNQQFVNEERLIRLGPEETVQWRLINPLDLTGEFDYRPAGMATDPAANKELRREQLTQMIGFLLNTGNPYVNYYELTKAWMESFDLRNVQKFLIPREVVAQQQEQEQGGGDRGVGGQPGAAGPQAPQDLQRGGKRDAQQR